MRNQETLNLFQLEREASERSLLLRIKVGRPLNLWALRLVVAEPIRPEKVRIVGEMKAWAYPGIKGLQLDTMKVLPQTTPGVGPLIWASTMAWALENTPCKQARLLAVSDAPVNHAKLTRYFRWQGFNTIKDVGSSPTDLPLRLVWGGAGSLMVANCQEVLQKNYLRWVNKK